jgi:hypothetical protein
MTDDSAVFGPCVNYVTHNRTWLDYNEYTIRKAGIPRMRAERLAIGTTVMEWGLKRFGREESRA